MINSLKLDCWFLAFAVFCIAACSTISPVDLPIAATKDVQDTPTFLLTDTAIGSTQVISTDTPKVHFLLPPQKDYIIYVKNNLVLDQNEIWAMNPTEELPVLVVSGKNMWPWGWSPSDKYWLFTAGPSIYIADSNGGNIHSVFEDEHYNHIYPFWLTDTTVLFNAYTDLQLPPDIYELDIETQVAERISSEEMFIQSVFPSEGLWLQVDWNLGNIEIVEQNGDIAEYLSDFKVSVSPFRSSEFQLLTDSDEILFKGNKDEGNNYQLWKTKITSKTVEVLFDPDPEAWIDKFLISPNEQYLAFTYPSSEKTFLNILNITTKHLDYQWIYPYWLNSSALLWSPDSQSIVLPYVTGEPGSIPEVDSGIQIMNVTTGETQVLLNENVVKISDWHFLK